MKRLIVGMAALAVTFFAATAVAAGPVIKNGGFETGDFTGWKVKNFGAGEWQVYKGNPTTPAPKLTTPVFPSPPNGKHAAWSVQGDPSTQILSQKFSVPKNSELQFTAYYQSPGADFATPDNLRAETNAKPNQQYRIDLMRAGAPVRSLKDSDVLKELFITKPGDAPLLDPTVFTRSLKKFAGQKVVLRFAVSVNENELNAGVDAVKVKPSQ